VVEENEFRSTYAALNQTRCVFEKAINARQCSCSQAERFMLAGREGVACHSKSHSQRCTAVLSQIRDNARFALKLMEVGDVLPHNKELRVQVGGLRGLRDLVNEAESGQPLVADIHRTLQQALAKYGDIDDFPYQQLMQSITAFEGRHPRRRGS
jgi:hypothetical protein